MIRTIHLAMLAAFAFACSQSPSTSSSTTNATSNDKYDTPQPTGHDNPCSLGQFGSCVTSDKCGADVGHLSSVSCNDDTLICCAALDRCTGTEDFVCCNADGTESRPICDALSGKTDVPLDCAYGQTRGATGQCAAVANPSCLAPNSVCNPAASPSQCCSGTCLPASTVGSPTPPQCM